METMPASTFPELGNMSNSYHSFIHSFNNYSTHTTLVGWAGLSMVPAQTLLLTAKSTHKSHQKHKHHHPRLLPGDADSTAEARQLTASVPIADTTGRCHACHDLSTQAWYPLFLITQSSQLNLILSFSQTPLILHPVPPPRGSGQAGPLNSLSCC